MPIYKSKFFWFAVLLWIFLSVGCFIYYLESDHFYDKLTAFGTITSVVGFVVALWQIVKTQTEVGEAKTSAGDAKTSADEAKAKIGEAKTSADEAKISAEKAKTSADEALSVVKEHVKRINRAFANSDVACYKQVPRDIINLLNKKELDWACEKMTSLRECLYEIVENPEYKESEAAKINGFVNDLIMHLTTMRSSEKLSDESKKVIVEFLDKVSAYLERLAKETKYSEAKEAIDG